MTFVSVATFLLQIWTEVLYLLNDASQVHFHHSHIVPRKQISSAQIQRLYMKASLTGSYSRTSRRLSSLDQLMRPVDPVRTLQSSGQHKNKGEQKHKACLFCRGAMLISHLYLFKKQTRKISISVMRYELVCFVPHWYVYKCGPACVFYSNRRFPSIVSVQHVPPSMHHWEESPRGQTECC